MFKMFKKRVLVTVTKVTKKYLLGKYNTSVETSSIEMFSSKAKELGLSGKPTLGKVSGDLLDYSVIYYSLESVSLADLEESYKLVSSSIDEMDYNVNNNVLKIKLYKLMENVNLTNVTVNKELVKEWSIKEFMNEYGYRNHGQLEFNKRLDLIKIKRELGFELNSPTLFTTLQNEKDITVIPTPLVNVTNDEYDYKILGMSV